MMKGLNRFLLGLVAFPLVLSAAPTSSDQAKRVVENWRAQMTKPLDSELPAKIAGVKSYYNDRGEMIFHVVSMEPIGFVVVAGDDQVEPIVAVVPLGNYDDPSVAALRSLLTQDLASRADFVRSSALKTSAGQTKGALSESDLSIQSAQDKWSRLSQKPSAASKAMGLHSLPDVRIAPLLTTKWNQKGIGNSGLTYNRFTPNNWHSGCTATAFAQILAYFKHDGALSTASLPYRVAGVYHYATMLGGDGNGGPYDWSLMRDGAMIHELDSAIAVGRLLFDAGITVKMQYQSCCASAYARESAIALRNRFSYSNAKAVRNPGGIKQPYRDRIVNSNLDAKLPMIFDITGHAVACDGYGYDSGTPYHHINMGWGGPANLWYNLPSVGVFPDVIEIVYNVYPSGSGEIISGRVVDSNHQPIVGAEIVAQKDGGGTYTATTDAQGIYALAKIPSNSSYTLSATKNNYTFSTQRASTLFSADLSNYTIPEVGNVWGADFQGTAGSGGNNPPVADAGADQNVDLGNAVTISGSATDSDGTIIAYQWSEGSTILATTASFSYTPASAGTKTLTLTVTDNDSATDSDTMSVVVANPPPPGDADTDGLLDTWEITHFGSITAQDGSGDPDSDGVSNEREETLGSDPNDAAVPGSEYANLCGWWKFDETTGTVAADSSGNESDADNANGVLVNQSGQLNGAFGFDGSNDSSATQGTAAPGNNLTITAWIRPSRLSGNQSIIAKNSSFTLKLNGSAICFTTPGYLDHHGSGEFVTDVWQFVAVTFTPSATGGCRFYRNGTFQNAINSSVMNQNSNPIVFGKNEWGQYFKGGLDDIRLYDRILTAAEIDALYQNTAPNTAPSVQDATFAMAEDAAVGATVGTVAASDPESDTLAFSITPGDFAIDPVSGEITVTGALDYETTPSYSLTVTVSDGALSDTATITIDITDVTDEDADGLDDAWEITHFGNRAQNASGDPDQDGYSNLQEAICGTHPADSNSCWLLEKGAGNLPAFYSVAGRKYTIRYSTNLVSQTWFPLGNSLSGTNGMMDVKNYDSSTNGFRAYRVEVEME